MPVSNVAPIIDYTANGVTVAFAYPFKTFFASDLQVYVDSVLQVGGYTVTGLGLDTGGAVTFSTAPANGAAVQIVRQLPFNRTTDYQPAGAFREDQVDRDQDIQTMQIQQLARDIGGFGSAGSRVMRLVDGDPETGGRFDARQHRIINLIDPTDPTDAVTLQALQAAIASATFTGVGIKSLPSYAAIALYTGGDNILYLEGRVSDSDGAQGFIYLDESDTTSAANGATIFVDGLNRRWKRPDSVYVFAAWFGAAAKGIGFDDRAALQNAINYCNSFTIAKTLVLNGMHYVTGSLIVDRLVDTTKNEFTIIGNGTDVGFIVDSAVNIFDSNLAMGVDPVSEFITFINVRFESTTTGGAYALTKKFFRMKFLNCYFQKIRLLASTTYIQTMYFDHCNIRFWPGVWLVASHAFDTKFNGCISEFGSGYLTNFANGSYSLVFANGVHEGSVGGVVSGGGFRQMKVDGYYFEANAFPDVDMSAGGVNQAVTITNNFHSDQAGNVANPNYYAVVWGATKGGTAGGSYHDNGRLHDNSAITPANGILNTSGDIAALQTYKVPQYANQGSGSFTLSSTLGTGTLNYARLVRDGKNLIIEFSFLFTGTSGSAAVLFDLPIASKNSIFSGSVEYSDYTAGSLRIVGGTAITGVASATRFGFAKDLIGTLASYTELNGKTIQGRIVYRVE